MKHVIRAVLVLAIIIQIMPVAFAAKGNHELTVAAALGSLQSEVPGLRVVKDGSRIKNLYGKPFGYGTNPENTAENFLNSHINVLGVTSREIKPIGPVVDGRHMQPLMYNKEIGEYKFTLIYYTQYLDNIPVHNSDLRLLVLNRADYPLVTVKSSLKHLGDFSIDPAIMQIDEQAIAANFRDTGFPNMVNTKNPRKVIWAEDDDLPPRVGIEFYADNGAPVTEGYRYIVDAVTGEILSKESTIFFYDVSGKVEAKVTPLNKAEQCLDEEVMGLPYAYVYIEGGNSAYCDADGDYTITDAGTDSVIINSEVKGLYFYVDNKAGDEALLVDTVLPPESANFLHNPDNDDEEPRAEVNAYFYANMVRDYVLSYNPAYPGLDHDDFPIKVNTTTYCPARYNGYEGEYFISFCLSEIEEIEDDTLTYPNFAFSSIVFHEYGHHVINMGGDFQPEVYSEGIADAISVLVSDNPGIGYGWYDTSCANPYRNADNEAVYPCSGDPYSCGLILSGCIWSTRDELYTTYPATYGDIIGNLTVNSILLYNQSGTDFKPDITVDFLVLDDDDGDLTNGTPHEDEICAGFGAHNMDCPASMVAAIYVDGVNGDDSTGDGTENYPYKTIQKGLDVAYKFDSGQYLSTTVLVKPGTYDESVEIKDSHIKLISADGPIVTKITSNTNAVTFKTEAVYGSGIEGFTIEGTNNGILLGDFAAPIIRNNIIAEAGKGISLGTDDDQTWRNTIQIINNTITDCTYGIYGNSVTAPIIKNNIIYDCNTGIERVTNSYYPDFDLSYNDLYGNNVNYVNTDSGTGDISKYPLLMDNYALRGDSPCLHAGDPDTLYNDPDGTRSDIGVPAYTVEVPGDYSTIQDAIDDVSNYTIIQVDTGTYNEAIDFDGKLVTVISKEGPIKTTITSAFYNDLVTFENGETKYAVIQGFKLSGGSTGVMCHDASPTIRRNILVENGQYKSQSGAICLLGDGWFDSGSSPAIIENNTIVECDESGIVDKSSTAPTIKNNIIYDNDLYGIDFSSPDTSAADPLLSYNCLYDNNTNYNNIVDSGTGTIYTDPLLSLAYLLKIDSPCIDTGDAAVQYNDPNGSRNDLGAWPFILGEGGPPRPKILSQDQENADMNTPDQFVLEQNYPNPFNPDTRIMISLPEMAEVKLEIYNILGQKVATLLDNYLEAGEYNVRWDGRDSEGEPLPTGIYLYKLQAGDMRETKKMLLLK
jgi:parallel beta-helix repeat protein